jgi:hypothetical protein
MKVVASEVVGMVDANWASRHRKKVRQGNVMFMLTHGWGG